MSNQIPPHINLPGSGRADLAASETVETISTISLVRSSYSVSSTTPTPTGQLPQAQLRTRGNTVDMSVPVPENNAGTHDFSMPRPSLVKALMGDITVAVGKRVLVDKNDAATLEDYRELRSYAFEVGLFALGLLVTALLNLWLEGNQPAPDVATISVNSTLAFMAGFFTLLLIVAAVVLHRRLLRLTKRLTADEKSLNNLINESLGITDSDNSDGQPR